ncbi:MAG: DUF2946 family protein [Undibacterium sp.]|uniref:DUF2946 family protein n=1 Tax=Undibacterium sp. TaxID=1914977 RepID=UPI002722C926|nr:DUF2946 family protein [Undibacterium sp.]MDO8651658.1 DUF2946 family protein [Undibacterium sp.]
MDDIVKQAMAKWPHVPHCYGWLGLDARGNWYMRDDRVQAAGSFAQSKGSLLKHEKLIDFIQRNYGCDDSAHSEAKGQWFFQNGPQRVYVELEATPLIWRVSADFTVHAHTGEPARLQRCVLDEHGRLYLEAASGFGLVHTQDMGYAADAVEQGLWVPEAVVTAELPMRFGYVRSPQAQHLLLN